MSADLDLLLGALALRTDFVTRDQLDAALDARALDQSRPLGELLRAQGALDSDERGLLERLAEKRLERDRRDADRTAALPAPSETVRSDPGAPAAPRQPGGARYSVLRPLARGGLGEVSVALDEELRREVALKEIRREYADDEGARRRFLLEAEVSGRLEHPNIVPVYGLGRHADGRPFYAMRLIRGETLQRGIARFHGAAEPAGGRALALRRLLAQFVAVCNAVAYAHSRGVLHRDVKPQNVLLGEFGETLLVDWGLAKLVGGGDPAALLPPAPCGDQETRAGAALGTPAYMSPEQADGRLDLVGPASDVYALGAILYALLAGRPPADGADQAEAVRKAREGDWPPPSAVKRGVPAALEAVSLKAMARRPEDRYPSAQELAAEVERWLADEGVRAWREPPTARAARWARRHQPLAAATAAGLLVAALLGGAGAAWSERQRGERETERARREALLRRGVEAALGDVTRLQREARWPEARATLSQAEARLGDGGPDDLRGRLGRARLELDLLSDLEKARLRKVGYASDESGRQALDFEGADRGYEAAFAAAGLGRIGEPPEAVAARVRASAVAAPLAAALDDWAHAVNDGPRRVWLLGVARLADPDPWRDRLRDPVLWRDKRGLARLAALAPLAALTPQLAAALGNLLAGSEEGEVLLRSAQRRAPGDFWLNFYLGNALGARGEFREAEGFYRAALAARPDNAFACAAVGWALHRQGRFTEALPLYRNSLAAEPSTGWVRGNLEQVERGAAVEPRLADFLAGKHRPAGNDERLALAHLCGARGLNAAAARLYAEAFAADPAVAEDLEAAHRYDAACYAAMAGCGRGEDAAGLDVEEKARLRARAIAWLRANLACWADRLGGGKDADRAEVRGKMRHWLKDLDLACVRDPAALEKLPEGERREWQGFWAEVDGLLAKAGAGKKAP
jgi:serine/threonine protein kinase